MINFKIFFNIMNKIRVERLVNKDIGQTHAKIFCSKIFSVDLTINSMESLCVIDL